MQSATRKLHIPANVEAALGKACYVLSTKNWTLHVQVSHITDKVTTAMKLFVDANYLSPYAMSVFVVLREKSVPFEIAPIDLRGSEQLAAPYAGVSTTLRVPTISHNRFNLSESSAICEYLEEAYPATPVYPSLVQDRAKAREIQAWLRSDLMSIRTERPTEVVFLNRTLPPLSSVAQAAARKLFNASEQLLPENRSTLFDRWSIADADLALMLNRLVMAGDYVPERLAQYASLQWRRSSVQEWVDMPRPLQ